MARPSTPPLLAAPTAWVTPASPTRPGPPVKFAQAQPAVIVRPAVVVELTAVMDAPTYTQPVPLSGQDLKEQTEREEEERKEQRRIEQAIEAEKRRRERRVPPMDDDDLDALIRSTQKLVKSVHIAPPGRGRPEDELDLNPAEDEPFALDKLRSHLERLYASVVFSLLTVVKEVIRIRGWEDGGKRTATALGVYIVAWYHGLIFTTLSLFITTLVLVPSSRSYCFGPSRHCVSVPLDPPDPTSITTLTVLEGPERPWGPAASERQASAWADQMESVLMSLVAPGGASSGKSKEVMEKAEEEVNGVMVKEYKHHTKDEHGADDMGRTEMAKEMYGKPGMKIMGGLVDKWERIANAINPCPPFVKPSRDRVFYILLLPMIIALLVITPKMVSRGCGAGFGFLMFGKPVIDWTIDELDRRIPTWRRKLIIEFNILADVPTNPQLVLRHMRDAEHQRRPLAHPEPERNLEDSEGESEEDEDGGEEDGGSDEREGGEKKTNKEKIGKLGQKVKKGTRAKVRRTWDKLGILKEESFALMTGHKKVNYEEKARNAMDRLHISSDSKPASKLLDKLPGVSEDDSPDTPSRFNVNHVGHGPGHIIIYPPTLHTSPGGKFTPARICLTAIRRVPTSQSVSLHPDQLDPTSDHLNPRSSTLSHGEKTDLVISINDIIAMKKTGLGHIAKMTVSWALDVEDVGGTGLDLTIIRRVPVEGGRGEGMMGVEERIELKKIVRRDQLFDRLIALGEQRWELM